MLKRCLLAFVLLSAPAFADPPVITNATAKQVGDLWRFDVTLRHGDTGWDHYADAWRVVDEQGKELGLRNLAHPHVDEQPFTRSLSGVALPAGTTRVGIQARDTLTGWGPDIKMIQLK